jgi:PAS domain S-box-containing protein
MKKETDRSIREEIFVIDTRNVYEKQLIKQSFNTVGFFIAVVDLNGNIVLINKRGRELLGCVNDEPEGKNFIEEFITRPGQSNAKKLFEKIINMEITRSVNSRYCLKTRKSNTIILEAENKVFFNKKNDVGGVIISGNDITDHVDRLHNLQSTVNFYSKLTENIPGICLFLFDKNLRFIIAGGGDMKNIGFAPEDFEGKTIYEINDCEIKEIWTPLFESVLDNRKIFFEYQYRSFIYRISALPVLNNRDEVSVGIAINQNITESKNAIRRLRRSTEDAEKAKQATSDFLALVSHEIRIPLSAVVGFAEQLSHTSLDRRQKEFVRIIDESSEHLMVLIDDILALSKIEAGEIHFTRKPFKIMHTIEHIYHSFAYEAKKKNLAFTYQMDERLDRMLIGDPFRLRQILINLLTNALKFTDEGHIGLKCLMEKETAGEIKVRFEITDTGIGISPSDLTTIFRPFVQAGSSDSRNSAGTGLGLTICKNLVEMQKGILSVSSRQGSGTTFWFVLPYKKGRKTDKLYLGGELVDQETLKGKRVILVDDDNFNRILGKTILKKFNCKFVIAKSGEEAEAILKASKFDIVLLDMHLSGVNGLDIAKFLRSEKNRRPEKIIAVTADVLNREIIDYYTAGINDFLIKPFKETDLFRKMCNVLQIGDHHNIPTRAELALTQELIHGSYDLTELKRISDGSEKLARKMLLIFIKNTESAIRKFERLLKIEDWNEIGETVHKILPSYRHLHAENLISSLAELKTKTLIDPDYDTLPQLVRQTISGMKKLIDELKSEIEF